MTMPSILPDRPAREPRSLRRRILVLYAVAVALGVGGFLSLGLPGALVLEPAALIAAWLGAPPLKGDQVWPVALGISMLGPLAMPPCYLLAARLVQGRTPLLLLTAGLTLVLDVLGSVAAIALADF